MSAQTPVGIPKPKNLNPWGEAGGAGGGAISHLHPEIKSGPVWHFHHFC